MSGVSLSGDKFFYDNPLESDGEHERQKWFGCACCPGNITRFVASIPGYIYAQQGKDIFVNLYAQGKAKIGNVELEQTTNYPWDGKIQVKVTKGSGKFAIKLRIPSWLKDSPTNNSLYKYMDAAPAYAISVNGVQVAAEAGDYATIQRKWKKGDVIELSLPMNIRRIIANDNAEDNRGKIALERGPVVFCLEGSDQTDGKVFNKYILNSADIAAHYEANLLNGVMVLEGSAKQLEQNGDIKDVKFRAIPYSTWNNRGPQQMEIWIANTPAKAVATPLPSIASKAQTFCNRGPIQNDAPETAPVDSWAGGTNDQWEPKCSSDTSKPYHYWWLKFGTTEAITYQFDKEYEVSNVQVYWLDFDHYDGNFRTPESWTLFYKDANGEWQEVKDHSPYTVRKDCYNSVDFAPVKTTGLKILAKLQKGESGGVLEWKIN